MRNGVQEKESRFDRLTVGGSGKPYWPNEANSPQEHRGLYDASRSAPFGVGLLSARGRRTELSGRDLGDGASARAKARGTLGLIVCALAFEVRMGIPRSEFRTPHSDRAPLRVAAKQRTCCVPSTIYRLLVTGYCVLGAAY